MGLLGWFFGGRRPSKSQGRKIHKQRRGNRRNTKLDRQLRDAGINPDLAYCTECDQWYNVNNSAQVDRHAH